MKNVFSGNKIRLRGMEKDDWKHFFAWDQDTEMSRAAYEIPFPRGADGSQKWAEEAALKPSEHDEFRFVIETLEDNQMVGTLNTHSCDLRNGTFSYGLAIAAEHRQRGYASEAISLVLNYFFLELRYQKCTVSVYSFNTASEKLHEKLGFTLEGRIRRMKFTGGQYYDHLEFGITVDEWERLSNNL
ncbi:MAG: GNAT family N-acetyltransferase [Anaerolineaceae bacterium]|nr:GNAT family N-acetyltransferase [Anaerolineaceae bacterium]